MKKILLLIAGCFSLGVGQAQTDNYWSPANLNSIGPPSSKTLSLTGIPLVFGLELSAFKEELKKAPHRENLSANPPLVMLFPNANGEFEKFDIIEAPLLHPELAAKYPHIKSYAGQGIDDPSSTIRFSISEPQGFHGMVLSGASSDYFIDPYNLESSSYSVYARKDLTGRSSDFQCLTEQDIDLSSLNDEVSQKTQRTNDRKLRKYRLALSCNAEYGNLFAGSGTDAQKKGNILSQMNITMTRVNGVYERDLAVSLELVPNNDAIIYFGSTTADPWNNEFNTKTQQVIDAAIGNANYDIGHNFNTSGGGNAGCIGCVCQTGSKGSGYTGRSNPTGDAFDIDYVAHEMGHQFGGYHTMNTCSRSGNGNTEVEPASGSSIMGYAGICATNVQNNSDDYFHYVNIRDISANLQGGISSGCGQVINLVNNPPTANAGPDYTIPRWTAFVLKGQGSDPDGDVLTYTWEQVNPQRAPTNGSPLPTWTQGPMFRSIKGTTSPDRFMPEISAVISGNLAPTWEVVPSVARTMDFALTVRDNKAGGGQTSDDLMRVTVSGTSGPFVVTAPNTNVTWTAGQTQTITWDVANTNAAPVSCSSVNILLSTDGGYTYPVTLVSSTPNDGSQAVIVPNNPSANCRVKIEGNGNIFYDISNANFTIIGAVACNPTVPANLTVNNISTNSVTLNWGTVSGATYRIRYRLAGTSTWTSLDTPSNTFALSGLVASTAYEVQVRSLCGTSNSAYSGSVSFTTTGVSQTTYCSSNGNNQSGEYISRVQLGAIDNSSGASSGGYGNFTALSTDLAKSSSNTITITPTWVSRKFNEGYSVWIDYNHDGDFTDSGEQVWTSAPTQTSPVSGTFVVPTTAKIGPTRMRVSMRYNTTPTACGSFNYGEVEDYTVNIINPPVVSCTDVTLTLKFDNYPEETSWNIKDDSGTTIASGGSYANSLKGSTLTALNCLPAGCYTFNIIDSYGDGICCAYGSGSYSLKDATGTTLASGASFGKSEATNFCISAGKEARGLISIVGDVKTELISEIYPNPVKDFLNISISEDLMPRLKIRNLNGAHLGDFQISENRIDVSSLPTGVYFISVETYKEVLIKKFLKQ